MAFSEGEEDSFLRKGERDLIRLGGGEGWKPRTRERDEFSRRRGATACPFREGAASLPSRRGGPP